MTQPKYYKAIWHNCNVCRIHYMSDQPHLRAYLCDDCWKTLPHFRAQQPKKENKMKQKNIIPAETWVLFYFIVGILLLGWSVYNIMVNEL